MANEFRWASIGTAALDVLEIMDECRRQMDLVYTLKEKK